MSTTTFQQIAAAANWQLRVNENFDSVSPAGLFGRNPATTTGLTWGYLGGEFGAVAPANGTVALTASTTNYIVAHRTTGVVTAATATTNWLNIGTYLQLYQVVTGASTVTSYVDRRRAIGAGVVFSVVAGTGITVDSTDPANPIINATGGGGGGSSDMFSPLVSGEIVVTTTATLTLGRMHACSGTSADYTLTLPAVSGNAGKFVGVRMAAGLTRLVTVKGNSTELIDGINTRVMWAGESAILLCDGTAWTKVGGRTKPMSAYMYRSGVFSSLASSTWTRIPINNIVRDSTSALASPMADATNGVIYARRAGKYLAQGGANISGVTAGYFTAAGVLNDTGTLANTVFTVLDNPYGWVGSSATSAGPVSGRGGGHGSAQIQAAAGSHFKIMAYNSMATSPSTTDDPSDRPTLSVVELPDW